MANCTANGVGYSVLKDLVLEVNFARQAVNARFGQRVMV